MLINVNLISIKASCKYFLNHIISNIMWFLFKNITMAYRGETVYHYGYKSRVNVGIIYFNEHSV